MPARYIAQAADRCGVFYESDEFPTLAPALACALAVHSRHPWPSAMTQVVNIDNVDIDCHDGLTEEEREEWGSTFVAAKSIQCITSEITTLEHDGSRGTGWLCELFDGARRVCLAEGATKVEAQENAWKEWAER
jgi:hypothetical protein